MFPNPRHFLFWFPQAVLMLAFVLIGTAQNRIVIGSLPWYPLDLTAAAFALASASLLLYRRWRGLPTPFIGNALIFAGCAALLVGFLVSFASNPISQTGLGQLKSWVLAPALFFLSALAVRPYLRERPLLIAWLFGAFGVGMSAWQHLLAGHRTYDGRLALPDASPNFLAETLAPGILIAFFALLFWGDRSRKILSTLALLTLTVPFAATFSYGALLALLSALAFLASVKAKDAGFSARRFLPGILVALALAGAFVISTSSEKARALFEERSSLQSRLMVWHSAEAMLAERPFAGIGIGRFQEVYLLYQSRFPPYLEWAVPQPHNLLFAFWLQAGLLGLVGFIVITAQSIRLLIWEFRHDEKQRDKRTLLLSLWIFILVFGLVDTPYFRNDLAFLFWMLVFFSLPQKPKVLPEN